MIGKEIANYRITEKLGEGGMGVVYKAVDINLDRPVAVKVLNSDLSRNPELVERFRGEARAQANLNHTNLATLYSFLVHEGTAMMVMEFVDGETLQKMVRRRGPIPSQEAIPIFKQALLGIGHAHRTGIIHRDLKPSNLMLGRNGIVKVMDFGIAKVLGTRGLTRTGTQMGTASYMSPEQVLNKPVDIRSDIYSLGVTLYEMLTAHVPFEADSDYQIMTHHVSTPPPRPTRFYPYIPKGVENAVLNALEKNPDVRFQTVEEFGQALEHPEDYVAPVAAVATRPAGRVVEGATRVTAAPQAADATQPLTSPPQAVAATQPFTVPSQAGGTIPPLTTPPLDVGATRPLTTMPEPSGQEAQGRFEGWLASKRTLMALGAAVLLLVAILIFALRPKPIPPAPSGPGGKGQGISGNTTPPPEPSHDILGNETNPAATGTGTGSDSTTPTKSTRTSQTTQSQKTTAQAGQQTGTGGTTQITSLLNDWIDSFKQKDVARQVDCYAPQVDIYYRKHNASRAFVEADKSRAMARLAEIRKFELSNVNVSLDSAEAATVTFDKSWDTTLTSGRQFAGSEMERLRLALVDGRWKIRSEEEVQIYHVVK